MNIFFPHRILVQMIVVGSLAFVACQGIFTRYSMDESISGEETADSETSPTSTEDISTGISTTQGTTDKSDETEETTTEVSGETTAGTVQEEAASGPEETTSTITAKYLGSYASKIKISGPEASHKDDIAAILQTVASSGQNFYGYACHDGTIGDDTSGFYWPHFLELVQKTTSTSLFCVRGEKHFGLGDRSDYDWAEAGEELSALSAKYPGLVGYNIDDFGGYDCSEDTTQLGSSCYTATQVKEFTDAAKTSNADFKLWPTIYFHQLGRTVVPGYILGTVYGVQMTKNEYAAVTLTFSLDSLPMTAELSFFYADTESGKDAVNIHEFKSVEVNGVSLVNATLAGNQYVEQYKGDIAPYLKTGENTITFKMYADSQINVYHHKLLYIWDVSLKLDGTDFSTWDVAYDKNESAINYTNHKGETINNVGRVVAMSNDEYSIVNSIDGIFVPFTQDQFFYNADTYADLLTSTKKALGDKDLIVVLYGEMWGYSIEPGVLKEQIEIASQIADGVVIWNYPLQLGAATGGIFSQRESAKAGYPIRFFWPMYQLGVEGYYQKWTTKKELSGTVTVKITDSFTTDSTTGYFTKKVAVGGVSHYEDTIPGSDDEELTLTLDTASKVVLSVTETDGVGNMSVDVYFSVVDADGNELMADDFDFESGTSNTQSSENYSAVKDLFLSLTPAAQE